MIITLNLTPELEEYLSRQAKQQQLSIETIALQCLTNSISVTQKQIEAVNLLQSWIDDEDTTEQKETGRYLIQALDEDRLSNRQMFPTEMKGMSW